MKEIYYSGAAALAAKRDSLLDSGHFQVFSIYVCACQTQKHSNDIFESKTGKLTHRLILCGLCAERIKQANTFESPEMKSFFDNLETQLKQRENRFK